MKLSKLALIAAIACGTYAGNVFAAQPNDIRLVSSNCDCGQPACGCESAPSCDSGCANGCDSAAGSGCDSACGNGCDSACGNGCDSACGSSLGLGDCLSGLGDCTECCLGDPYQLFGEHCGWSAGGWMQLGYHTAANSLFNTRPDELQLQQAWLYAEKAIDTSCGFDMGGRIDYLYGTDGPNTQAFGTDPRGWDNSWDNGGDYGHAIPQLYAEAGYGDLSVKAGHFFTIIGYEVVGATGNFFYSHAYTFNNSEPFTHTGVLAQYQVSEDVKAWSGYTLGWDSGFDDNGDAFLGGLSMDLTEDLNLTYTGIGGRFAEARFRPAAVRGYMHSIVGQYAVTDSLKYVLQSDVLDTELADGSAVRETFGVNQYLIKSLNDCWGIGGRFEWWNVEDLGAGDSDVYALTTGLNYRPHANVIVRPEVRWDWDEDQVAGLEDGDDNQTTFGVDTILTF
jgi:Putative beta-barrel porin-2, OmpL-like. bbp2